MKSMQQNIREAYLDLFPVSKLRADLFNFLNENPNGWFVKNGADYVVDAWNPDKEETEAVTINEADMLTVITYNSRLSFAGSLAFEVNVGIGEFAESEVSFSLFKLEKCFVRLYYNEDLSVWDGEFAISETNRSR